MIEESRTYQVLAMLGTFPFIASAGMAIGGVTLGPIAPAVVVASSYGLAILCFLCGAHWATYLYKRDETPFNLFVISNIVVVVIWLTYLLTGQSQLTLASQVLAFAFLLDIDRRLVRVGLVSAHYFRIRLQATIIAVISLLIVMYVYFA